jgi:hypothetical protein
VSVLVAAEDDDPIVDADPIGEGGYHAVRHRQRLDPEVRQIDEAAESFRLDSNLRRRQRELTAGDPDCKRLRYMSQPAEIPDLNFAN